jgi:hypothetical protein
VPVPAVIQYPTRTAPAVRGRRANVTPGRWATIQLVPADPSIDERDREQVINISLMIPPDRPPELPGLVNAGPGVTNNYFLERVSVGVEIGMIRGGTVDAVGGFGFQGETDLAATFRVRESGSYSIREGGGYRLREATS